MLDAAENTSLLRRLAGPSTGKAGLAKDQTEINRIIAEASKGSPFYENERKKDEQVTRRIEVLLKKREELAKAADIAKLEANAERLIAELEATRDLSQIICHVDMDAFYSSVEVLDNPELADKAFAVTGGGVLSTASYEARKWGVRSGMATFIAKKLCPDLICVAHHFPRYIEMSKAVMSVMRKYDSNMASWGLDEAYLNLTQYCAAHNLTAEACVAQMREEVHRETKLTCSAGIAPNKMLAKICSDRNKPNGQYYLAPDRDSVMTFTHDLSIRKIPGIGRVTERVIESVGIKTCGDIYTHRAAISMLDKELGLKSLLRAYLGIASNVVEPWARESTKSVGSERTFKTISDTGRLLEKLDEIAETLESDLEHGGWCGRTITLRYKLDTFQSFTRAKTMDRYVKSKQDLFAVSTLPHPRCRYDPFHGIDGDSRWAKSL
ncbi:hypothetical protein BOTBODRAFT_36509 [Botryobasidium botryosum FD-172 SS1]|uniref:DNA polymerase kappa n=1 Tax=Botryobasidium botryosum (strain FD-172 SS1) TaxID=930990 RepID=A0A067M5T1_BOTB1|nr:hypothetical protein BOTBODRAFT_36509 [Botryobasidium botryosum FD-172 SS1]